MSDETTTQPAKVEKKTKARLQAEQAKELLEQGPVTKDMLRAINEDYPGDPISFFKSEFKTEVHRYKLNGMTTYSLTPPASTAALQTGTVAHDELEEAEERLDEAV